MEDLTHPGYQNIMEYQLFRNNFASAASVSFGLRNNGKHVSDGIIPFMNVEFSTMIWLDKLFKPNIDSNCIEIISDALKERMHKKCVSNKHANHLGTWASAGAATNYIFEDITLILKSGSHNWIINSETDMVELQKKIETLALMKQCQIYLDPDVNPFCDLSFEIISNNIKVRSAIVDFDVLQLKNYGRDLPSPANQLDNGGDDGVSGSISGSNNGSNNGSNSSNEHDYDTDNRDVGDTGNGGGNNSDIKLGGLAIGNFNVVLVKNYCRDPPPIDRLDNDAMFSVSGDNDNGSDNNNGGDNGSYNNNVDDYDNDNGNGDGTHSGSGDGTHSAGTQSQPPVTIGLAQLLGPVYDTADEEEEDDDQLWTEHERAAVICGMALYGNDHTQLAPLVPPRTAKAVERYIERHALSRNSNIDEESDERNERSDDDNQDNDEGSNDTNETGTSNENDDRSSSDTDNHISKQARTAASLDVGLPESLLDVTGTSDTKTKKRKRNNNGTKKPFVSWEERKSSLLTTRHKMDMRMFH